MATKLTNLANLMIGDLVRCKRSFLDPWREGYVESIQVRPREVRVRCGRNVLLVAKSGKVIKLHGAEMEEARVRLQDTSRFLPRAATARLPQVGPPVLRIVREAPPLPPPRPQPKPEKPVRDPEHLAYVRLQPCCSCKRPGPSDPHHFGPHPVGEKGSDHETVPLCREEHGRVTDTLPLLGLDMEGTMRLFEQEALRLLSQRVQDLREERSELATVPVLACGVA